MVANKRFLDRTIARGDDVVLATPINSIKDDLGYYAGELRYLASKGYTPSPDGTRLILPGG